MAGRTAVLVDERDQQLGATTVPENSFVIQHHDRIFVRTEKAVRLSGGGVGIMFFEVEPILRNTLVPR